MGRYLIPGRGEMFGVVDPLTRRKRADLLPAEPRAQAG